MCLLLDVRVRRRSLVSSEPCLPINSLLCHPLSLWKMKSVYHGDWHCIISLFFHTHTTHQHALPPNNHLLPLRHTHAYIHPAATDSVAATASACHLLWCAWCMTATPVHWVCHSAALGAGGGNSHVCAVNICSFNWNTTGKLLHCVGQHGKAQFCQQKSRSGSDDEALMGYQ